MNQAQSLRVRQRTLEALLTSLRGFVLPLLGKTSTPGLVRAVGAATRPYVNRARSTLAVSATQQYRAFLARGQPITKPTLTRFTQDAWNGSANKVLTPGEVLTADHLESLENKAAWWAQDAERGTLIHYATKDKRIYAWARVDGEPPSCPFCTVLISRGSVYHTQDAATVGEVGQFHTGCKCTAVLVSRDTLTSFEGYQQQLDAEAEYVAARKRATNKDLSGIVAAIKELRANSEGKTP